jgi:hypothetical protein
MNLPPQLLRRTLASSDFTLPSCCLAASVSARARPASSLPSTCSFVGSVEGWDRLNIRTLAAISSFLRTPPSI